MSDRVANGFGQIRDGRDAANVILQPGVQSLDNRATSLLANMSSVLGGMAADLGFNGIEFTDFRQHPGGKRRFGGDPEIVKAAPHVCPAERQRHRTVRPIQGEPFEPVIAVDLKHAAEPGQVPGGAAALAVLGVDIGGDGVGGSGPRSVVNRVAPDPSGLGSAAARIEHRQGGIISKQLRRRQRRADQQVIQRCQPPAGAANPVAQRRAVQCDALARQHLRLPIQRQRITEFADQHMRHQRLGGHAAVDWTLRRRGDHDSAFAGPAGVTRAARDTNPQLRGHDVKLLTAQFADRVHCAAAAGAVAMFDIDQHLIARQMRRKGAVVAVGACLAPLALSVRRRILRGFVRGDGLLQVLQCQLQLIRTQLFRAAAKLLAQQTLDQQVQLVDFGIALLQSRLLLFGCGDHIAQHLLQRGRIVRQGGEVDLHDSIMINAVESAPMTPA